MSTPPICRVQWRRAGGRSTASTRTRVFARGPDAWRFAARVHAGGGMAIVAEAERSPWITAEEVAR
ncbi:MAG: hypothetical protein WKF86_07365 [Acidimicrobiales bacterium]